jgi:hypothetical protein
VQRHGIRHCEPHSGAAIRARPVKFFAEGFTKNTAEFYQVRIRVFLHFALRKLRNREEKIKRLFPFPFGAEGAARREAVGG